MSKKEKSIIRKLFIAWLIWCIYCSIGMICLRKRGYESYCEVFFPVVSNYEPLISEIGKVKKISVSFFNHGSDTKPIFLVTTEKGEKYKVELSVDLETEDIIINDYKILKSA